MRCLLWLRSVHIVAECSGRHTKRRVYALVHDRPVFDLPVRPDGALPQRTGSPNGPRPCTSVPRASMPDEDCPDAPGIRFTFALRDVNAPLCLTKGSQTIMG